MNKKLIFIIGALVSICVFVFITNRPFENNTFLEKIHDIEKIQVITMNNLIILDKNETDIFKKSILNSYKLKNYKQQDVAVFSPIGFKAKVNNNYYAIDYIDDTYTLYFPPYWLLQPNVDKANIKEWPTGLLITVEKSAFDKILEKVSAL